jgi:hypothetical protein
MLMREVPESFSEKYIREPSVTRQHLYFPSLVSGVDLSTLGCGAGSSCEIPRISAATRVEAVAIAMAVPALRRRGLLELATSFSTAVVTDGCG